MVTARQRQDKLNYERKLMSVEPKDPSKKHFRLSMVKSGLRLLGCAVAFATNAIGWFVILFAIAELVGIWEEL